MFSLVHEFDFIPGFLTVHAVRLFESNRENNTNMSLNDLEKDHTHHLVAFM